jgi:signal transduction histidine kinase
LKLFRPLNVWLAVNGVTLILMIAVVASITSLARDEARRLVQLQADTLVRARIHDLERGDYRGFVEGVGGDFGHVSVAVTSPEGRFSQGADGFDVCASTAVPRAGGDLEVRLCREASRPSGALVAVLLAYGAVAVGIWLLLGRLEGRAVGQLLGFFAGLGVPVTPRSGLVGLLAQVKEILVALDEARRREMAPVRQAALVETARQVAHDIRSPLAALKTALTSGASDGSAARERHLAEQAMARIEAIAADLLARGRRTRPTVVALPPLIESVVEERRACLEPARGLVIAYESRVQGASATAVCDAATLSRVISNLLNNAVDAASAGGRIDVVLEARGDRVDCVISDDGCGIPPEVLPLLMRAGASFGKSGGSGLGLHHARLAAEAWGGTLKVASTVGVGTTVTLSLPRARPVQGPVVLIDDDVWVREAWELAGAKAGASVRTFASLADCESVLSELPRDAAIYVDLELDGERGDEVGRVLSERGFANLYLATGHEPEEVGPWPWFKAVVGKEPRLAAPPLERGGA